MSSHGVPLMMILNWSMVKTQIFQRSWLNSVWSGQPTCHTCVQLCEVYRYTVRWPYYIAERWIRRDHSHKPHNLITNINMITLQNYYHRMHEAMWSYNIPRFKVEKGFERIQTYHQPRSHWCRRSCPDTAHTADLWHTFYRDIDLCRWGGRHYFPAPCRGGHIHTLRKRKIVSYFTS